MLSAVLNRQLDSRGADKPFFRLSERRLVMVLIVTAVLIRLPLVAKPFNLGGDDAWREADTASIAHNFYHNGNFNIFYPQINWRGDGPGYVETEFQLFTFITSLSYAIFGEHVWLGRFISLLFSIPTMLLIYLWARRRGQQQGALFALAFIAVTPLSVRYSTVFMPESTVLLFYVLALYLFQKWLDESRFPLLILAAASTALAILVKPTSIHIGLILLALVYKRYGFRLFARPELWLFAAISLLPAAAWYLHARNLYLVYGNTFGLLSGGDSKFGNLNVWLRPSFYWRLIEIDIKWVFAVGGVLPFVVGLYVMFRRRRTALMISALITLFIYYLLIARYSQFAFQYHVYALPYAALGVGLGAEWLVQQIIHRSLTRDRAYYLYIAAGLLSVILIVASSGVAYRRLLTVGDPSLAECAGHIKTLTPDGAYLIVSTTSFTADADGTPNNYQEPQLFFYSHRYGWSLPADWHTPQKVTEYRQQGASYLVIHNPELYFENPALVQYLDDNAEQIGPGVEAGCGIFQFVPHQS